MFCEKCGAEVAESSKFCKICGTSFVPAQEVSAVHKKADKMVSAENLIQGKKKSMIVPLVVLLAIILIILIVLLVVFFISNNKEKDISDRLSLADKYMNQLDYDHARAAYKEVLDIDPDNVDAYLGLAEIYCEEEAYVEAINLLDKGISKTDDKRLVKRKEEIEAILRKKQAPSVAAPDGVSDPILDNNVEEDTIDDGWERIELSALPKEKELTDLLDQFAWHLEMYGEYGSGGDFDCENPDNVIDWIVYNCPCVPYYEYPIKQPVDAYAGNQVVQDPLNRMEPEFCREWEEASVDWILENILNIKDSDAAAMKKEWERRADIPGATSYYYDYHYYNPIGGVGDSYNAVVSKAYFDGEKYRIVYKIQLYANYVEAGYREAILDLKKSGAEEFWSIYSDKITDYPLDIRGGEEWKQEYINVAEQYIIDSDVTIREQWDNLGWEGDCTMFSLVYIDDDPIPELVIDPQCPFIYGTNTGIYSIINDHVENIVSTKNDEGWFIHPLYYTPRSGRFYINYEGDGGTTKLDEFRLKDGVISLQKSIYAANYEEYEKKLHPEVKKVWETQSTCETFMTFEELAEALENDY